MNFLLYIYFNTNVTRDSFGCFDLRRIPRKVFVKFDSSYILRKSCFFVFQFWFSLSICMCGTYLVQETIFGTKVLDDLKKFWTRLGTWSDLEQNKSLSYYYSWRCMFSCSIRFFFLSTNEIVNLSVILQIDITKTSKKKKEVILCWSPASNNRKCNFYSFYLPRLKNFNSFLRKHTLLFLVGRILFHFFSKKCFKKKEYWFDKTSHSFFVFHLSFFSFQTNTPYSFKRKVTESLFVGIPFPFNLPKKNKINILKKKQL